MTGKEALTILKTGQNCLLTGPAGSGKTHVLDSYVNYLKKEGVPTAVTASTGIAATHLGGQTIHSWSGMGIKDSVEALDLDDLSGKSYLIKKMDSVRVLIIDEVSMLHHFQLDMVDMILRHFKKNDQPFGGIQVVLAGDFFQLPPVASRGRKSLFAYHADVWGQANFRSCYLETQYRQTDKNLLGLLEDIRSGRASHDTKVKLLACDSEAFDCDILPTRLYTHNIDVDRVNLTALADISGQSVNYEMRTKGSKTMISSLVKNCLAPEVLSLKPGAKVMFVKNNFDLGYANGTLGVVTTCGSCPKVRLSDGREIEVEPMTWSIEEEGKVKAEITQVPLRLAWAITVHKSQGMSLDSLEVDLSRAFEPGMGYVALSRAKKLSGLVVTGLNAKALEVNDEALSIDSRLRELSQTLKEKIAQTLPRQMTDQHVAFIEKNGGQAVTKVSTLDQTKAMLAEKLSLADIARKRNLSVETIISHLEKIIETESSFDLRHIKGKIPPKKFKQINDILSQFDKGKDILLSPVKQKLPASVSFNDIRLVRVFYYQDQSK